MDQDFKNNPTVRPYFRVERPAHFRFRPDLIEELCVADAMNRTLPRTEASHRTWLTFLGLDTVAFPWAKMQPFAGQPYRPTARYVLSAEILPGKVFSTNLITDTNLWTTHCEHQGLFQAVINRAVECAILNRIEPANAQAMFTLQRQTSPSPSCRSPHWAVGYEVGTGLCTILAMDQAGTWPRFLGRTGGIFAPPPNQT